MRVHRFLYSLLALVSASCLRAQDAVPPDPATQSPVVPNSFAPAAAGAGLGGSSASLDEKWKFFVSETFTPMLMVAVLPDATASQLTRSAPLYGKHFWHRHAFLKRIGATTADDTSQNFFADYLLASAFHEDTRYVRAGHSHGVFWRMGYAVSRAVVTRTDSGDATFSWANVLGCAMSAALSNAYYPPASRTAGVALTNWGTNVAGSGLSNFMPEFGADVGHWFKRHLFRHQSAINPPSIR